MAEHIHKNCHVHIRCPKCKGGVFEIMIYEKETIIKCVTDGESVPFNKDLINAFKANLHEIN